MFDRVLPAPAMPNAAPPASPALPGGARAFWVQWLRARARLGKTVELSPAAALEVASMLEQGPTRTG